MASSVLEGHALLEVDLSSSYSNLEALKYSLFLNSICKYYFGVKSFNHPKGTGICFIRSHIVRVDLDHYYLFLIFFFLPII